MKFNLRKPCANCPFRNDRKFHLGRGRAAEIAHETSKEDRSFTCHKTLGHDEEEDSVTTPRSEHCAGVLIILEKEDNPNQAMRIAERLGMYDRHKLEMDSPVYSSMKEFVKAQEFL